ncbi:hypothetical protein SNOUR_04545 [Streptomyces noursei ATCC 11455]|uniref:hypothetical protein n=1 Tax=Streptomyces noursei TaxID=1971 RepID=UPI00081C40A9|nr:hypothetical protein SNOUR_04545 [Streptomyces noursei ATCC 11455]
MVLPDTMKGIQNIYKAMYQGGVNPQILELVHLRASQIDRIGTEQAGRAVLIGAGLLPPEEAEALRRVRWPGRPRPRPAKRTR